MSYNLVCDTCHKVVDSAYLHELGHICGDCIDKKIDAKGRGSEAARLTYDAIKEFMIRELPHDK